MSERTLIVGDVHGCLDELERLVDRARLSGSDSLVLVGDLVAKGPASLAVVRYVRANGRAVLGNHDAALLRFAPGAQVTEKRKRKLEALAQTLDADDWAFLQALPLFIALPDQQAIVVHGGLVPGVALTDQERDVVTNLRSIRPDGSPSKHIEDGAPWASLWRGPEHVYFGHDAIRGLQRHAFATGLDTGCVYGGALTGVVLPERELISVPAARTYAEMDA